MFYNYVIGCSITLLSILKQTMLFDEMASILLIYLCTYIKYDSDVYLDLATFNLLLLRLIA